MHKKCSGIEGQFCPDPEFRCIRCLGTARAIGGIEDTEVEVGTEKLKVVPEFGHALCRWWLPLLTNRHLPHLTRGRVYSTCMRSVMLHAAETWAMNVDILNRLRRNDRAMIHWICNVKAKDEVSSELGIQDIDVVLYTSRMRWFGHVERKT